MADSPCHEDEGDGGNDGGARVSAGAGGRRGRRARPGGGADRDRRRPGQRRAGRPGWHILVYTVNDSSSDLPLGLDIDEMVNASRSGVNFTVYVDSSEASAPFFASRYVPTTDEAVIVEITGGSATVDAAPRRARQRLTPNDRLVRRPEAEAHPTERTALVVWDHGLGWQGIAFDENVTATGDTSAPSYLDAPSWPPPSTPGWRRRAETARPARPRRLPDGQLRGRVRGVRDRRAPHRFGGARPRTRPRLRLVRRVRRPGRRRTDDLRPLADGFVSDVTAQSPDDADTMTLSLIDLDPAPSTRRGDGAFTRRPPPTWRRTRSATSRPPLEGSGTASRATTGPASSTSANTSAASTASSGAVLAARDTLLATPRRRRRRPDRHGVVRRRHRAHRLLPDEPREYNARYDSSRRRRCGGRSSARSTTPRPQVVLQSDIGFVERDAVGRAAADGSTRSLRRSPPTSPARSSCSPPSPTPTAAQLLRDRLRIGRRTAGRRPCSIRR